MALTLSSELAELESTFYDLLHTPEHEFVHRRMEERTRARRRKICDLFFKCCSCADQALSQQARKDRQGRIKGVGSEISTS